MWSKERSKDRKENRRSHVGPSTPFYTQQTIRIHARIFWNFVLHSHEYLTGSQGYSVHGLVSNGSLLLGFSSMCAEKSNASSYVFWAWHWCHSMIDGPLTNQIALLLPARGRTDICKMFGIDCRRFFFFRPLHPSRSPPSHYSPFLAHLRRAPLTTATATTSFIFK